MLIDSVDSLVDVEPDESEMADVGMTLAEVFAFRTS
jgi:hypothetical protein